MSSTPRSSIIGSRSGSPNSGTWLRKPLLRLALRPRHDGAQPALDLVAADRDLFDIAVPQERLEVAYS
jgi:hypothetical protein